MKEASKRQAIELRKSGYSIKDIAKTLSVAKSSVSNWVRDINLSLQQQERLRDKQVATRVLGSLHNQEKAQERHDSFRNDGFERAKQSNVFAIVCALYWGEGSKTGKCFKFTNSDPHLINYVLSWIQTQRYDFTFSVQYYAENGLSENEIVSWWLEKIDGLKTEHFRKNVCCRINRASQRKKIGRLPYGTASIYVMKSTGLFFRIMGGIDYLKTTALSSMVERQSYTLLM